MIVPALLTEKRQDFIDMLNTCAQFTGYVQVDIMDGKFVSSKSIQIDDLEGISSPVSFEAHLMVEEPLEWLESFKNLGAKKIIFHFEIDKNHIDSIKKIKSKGMLAGIAVNPKTKIEEFEYLLNYLDSVLFMSVIPGYYGSAFIPEVLEKIKEFKKNYPEKQAGIDGGIKFSNIKDVMRSGVDYACVGSAILKAENPIEAYRSILEESNISRNSL